MQYNQPQLFMMEQIRDQILKEKLKDKPNFSLIRKLQQLIDKVKN
jgi:tRNA A-37 threonylcarbamoyl transferase component Bud32|tara:strand:+ start:324 stop:458 length:135 start_codon:yes stop_codon:yes gene_type:complete